MIPALALAALGTLASAYGSIQQGEAQQKAADYNAQVARVAAINAQNQATAQAQQVAQSNARKLGDAQAAFGAAGVDTEGTPLAVMSDLATQGELSRKLTLYKGTVAAQSDNQQALADIAQGQDAASAGIAKAGGTLLTGLGTVGNQAWQLYGGSAGTSPSLDNAAKTA